ncbi:tyrosine-type recombinase/integrase [Mycolicibacterium stellerae]|uniref:tyrosine-type recombinase/integrase n=1 Tax=Mycolicibacterium stellerae TaxID=2358193 RepID=UPI001F3D00CA|nr:tyrosine-type recombinase/integrase [Mycolicibacterium stellerae]
MALRSADEAARRLHAAETELQRAAPNAFERDRSVFSIIVATKTQRSARDLPLPPQELAMVRAMRTVHARERLAMGRPPNDDDLLLSRIDGTRLPVRDYSREFAVQRTAAGLKAISMGKLRHSNISRMRAAGIAADVVAAWHGHTQRMTQAVYGRVTDDRLTAASAVFSTGQ